MNKEASLFLIWALLGSISAMGQTAKDAPHLNIGILNSALKTPFGYQRRDSGDIERDRYEGLYSRKVAGSRLYIVSVTRGKIAYELDGKSCVPIKAPEINEKFINVGGVNFGMQLNVNYRFDLQIQPGKEKCIPVNAVLEQYNIYGSELGVFGYLGPSQRPTLYIPLEVGNSVDEKPADKSIRVILIPSADMLDITCSYALSVNEVFAHYVNGMKPSSISTLYKANQPIIFIFSDATFVSGNEYSLRFVGRLNGDSQARVTPANILITSSN